MFDNFTLFVEFNRNDIFMFNMLLHFALTLNISCILGMLLARHRYNRVAVYKYCITIYIFSKELQNFCDSFLGCFLFHEVRRKKVTNVLGVQTY